MPQEIQKRKRTNFRLPPGILKWAQTYAKKNHVSLTQVVIDGLTQLKEKASVKHQLTR